MPVPGHATAPTRPSPGGASPGGVSPRAAPSGTVPAVTSGTVPDVTAPEGPLGGQEASVARGWRRIRYAATAPAPNSAARDTPVASQVAPSHWLPK